MAWQLKGTYFENCNCDVVCPCSGSSLTLPADNDRCRVALAFHVDSGAVDGIDVSGLSIILVADAPRQMTDGNWNVGVVMDATASAAQAQVLAAVFSGQKGGPMALLAPLIGKQLGVETAKIDYADGGATHSVKAGSFVDMIVEDLVPQGMTEPTKLAGIAHPVNTTLTVARAKQASVQCFGLAFSNTGKNGHAAPFSWAG